MSWAVKLVKPYRVEDGSKFRLKDFDPGDTGKIHSKRHAKQLLNQGIASLAELQDKLYAQNRWGVLLIFQAMDAAGKDGVIKHVMSGVNPQGVQVYSFKAPSVEELNHDYLWRTTAAGARAGPDRHLQPVLLRRGAGGAGSPESVEEREHSSVFDNQGYLDGALSGHQCLRALLSRATESWSASSFSIFRRRSRSERFLARLEHPEKNWKFSPSDVRERQYWDDYMKAYEDMIVHTASPHAPWYVVPADNKWFTRLVVAAAVVETLEDLKLAYPRGRS